MKKGLMICVLAAASAMAQTQEWEIGVLGGYGFAPDLTVDGRTGSAKAGFKNGLMIGVFGGNDMYNYWSGEARYLYRYSDLRLSNAGTSASFNAHQHIIHADFLGHFTPRESTIRPFIAFGGGVKVLQGTGIESAAQPLGQFAALTATRELLPVADIGVGVKAQLTRVLRFRAEFRDYISPAPSKVIAPAPGASIGGVLNDFTGLIGFSLTW